MVIKKAEENTAEAFAANNARKRKRVIPTRTAGTPANPVFNNPADELFAEAFAHRPPAPFSAEILPVLPQTEEIPIQTETTLTAPTLPSRDTTSTTPSQGQSRPKKFTTIAPESNYQKVTNTITREAIPQGLFKPGKSKQIYDVLYGLTRGAIVAKRIVRISKPKLRALSGVGARTTMDACLAHLQHVGLIRQQVNDGGFHEGNDYEIFTPEEITPTTALTASSQGKQGEQGNQPEPAANLGSLGSLETRDARQGSSSIDTGIATGSKTSFKDNKDNDDEAFAPFIKKFQKAAKELTGKKLVKRDAENLEKIADLLILELNIASRKTGVVSSVPAFLSEVLRRQFAAARHQLQQTSGKLIKTKPDTVGRGEPENKQLKTLDREGRELAVAELREFIDSPFLDDYRQFYTESDWKWITENLK